MRRLLRLGCGLLVAVGGLMACPAQAQTPKAEKLEPRMMMTATYFREETDHAWELRLVGEVPSAAGMYFILHDGRGRLTLKKHVPYGQYTADAPLVIPIAADGYTGDYRLLAIGFQEDIRGILLPMSTLPLEVYGGTYFAARGTPPIYFKAPPGQEVIDIRSYLVGQDVHQGDELVLNTQRDGKLEGRNWFAPLKVTPDAVYNFKKMNVFYFGARQPIYLCFDIQRWFAPDTKLDDIRWWELTK